MKNRLIEFYNTKRTLATVLLVGVFFAFGIYIGFHNQAQISKAAGVSDGVDASQVDLSAFWKVWNMIDQKYPGADKTTQQQRVYGAISGLVGSLNDPYSIFFKPDEAKSFEDDIAGNFIGVGMEVGLKDKILTVVAPLKDTPADKAGIKPGDKILKIDGKSTADMTVDSAVKLIRGEKGTTVIITIFRDGESTARDIKIVRDVINTPTIDTELRSDGVFVVKLYSFSANSASLFHDAMLQFAKTKSTKLLLDLRGNPGGYLDAAVDISSWFLPKGAVVVTEDYGTDTKPTVYRSKGYTNLPSNLKFAILVDGGSASASEIVSGAMQDQKKAILVGAQSYGKGSVQQVEKVTPDTLLKITVAKWLTPNGTSISLKGLTPDYKVDFTKADADAKKDPQMDKAIELLNNWTPIK